MRRIITLLFLAGVLSLLLAPKASANANVSLQQTITPMQCSIEVVNDGSQITTRLVPAACQRAFKNDQSAVPAPAQPTQLKPVDSQNTEVDHAYVPLIAAMWLPVIVPYSRRA